MILPPQSKKKHTVQLEYNDIIQPEHVYLSKLKDITYIAKNVYHTKSNAMRGYCHRFKLELVVHAIRYKWDLNDIAVLTGIPVGILYTWDYLFQLGYLVPTSEDKIVTSYGFPITSCTYATYLKYVTSISRLVAYHFNLWYKQYAVLFEYLRDEQHYTAFITNENSAKYLPYYILTLATLYAVEIKTTMELPIRSQIQHIQGRLDNLSKLQKWYRNTYAGKPNLRHTVYVTTELPDISDIYFMIYEHSGEDGLFSFIGDKQYMTTILTHLPYKKIPLSYYPLMQKNIYYMDNTFFIVPRQLHLYVEYGNWDWEIVTLPKINITTVPLPVDGTSSLKNIQDVILQCGFNYVKILPLIAVPNV